MVNKKLRLGIVSSGGGLRTYYNAGLFYMLKKHGFSVTHITGASGGITAGALPYLAARDEHDIEEFIKKLAERQSLFSFKRSLLTPSLFNLSGGYLLEMNKSFLMEELIDFSKREIFLKNLEKIILDISVTDITDKVENQIINFNKLILEEKDYEKAFQVLQATTCTIPLIKSPKIDGVYYLDGGYTKNSPLKNLFENPNVDAIILIDFTDYRKYDEKMDEYYRPNPLRFIENFINMHELAMQISFDACNETQLEHALFLNNLIKENKSITLNGKKLTYKPVLILKPVNLEMNPLIPNASELAWEYYELGKKEAEVLLIHQEDEK